MRKHGFQDMAGCLPLLLQIPMFFALSRVLSSSIELYQAPFFFWIKDLSAHDPYLILPLLIGLTMIVQAGFADKQQRASILVMALIFGAFTTTLSAGLALYIFVSTFLSVAQTAFQKKLSKSPEWV
jgi:YidC/Oxa1 family membrane protein insertase